MARRYRTTGLRRLGNRLMAPLVRRGRGPERTWLITVPGRRSGEPHTTPVNLVEDGGQRWLVAPYGAVGWVRNLRAGGRVTLTRGARAERARAVEVGPEEAAPVLRRYLADNRITRPFFDVRPDSPLADFAAEAARHPVFRIVPET